MLKILVADSTKELCTAITEAFSGRYAVSVCYDGKTALEKIRTLQPDILWLDLMLPGMDGITILQAATMAGRCPKVIACSRQLNAYVQQNLSRFGACYLLRKPCSTPAALSRIEDVARSLIFCQHRRREPEELVYDILLLLGATGKRSGHSCLEEAVRLKVRNPGLQTTKTLYPEVAKLCGGSVARVERAIRNVIHLAWDAKDEQIWLLYFPDCGVRCPSNGVFIETLADCVRKLFKSSEEVDEESSGNTDKNSIEIAVESC